MNSLPDSSFLRLPRQAGLGWAAALIEKATGLRQIEEIYCARPDGSTPAEFVRFTLALMGLRYRLVGGTVHDIPAQGPLIVVANHPYGASDGLVLADLILQQRHDTLLLANTLLQRIPELAPIIAPVDVFRAGASLGGIRAALRHLSNGGALVIFPAGEVSRLDLRRRRVADLPWADSVAMLARRGGATVLPLHIEGRANWRSLLAGVLHPRLRTACLARDLLRTRNTEVAVHLGELVPAAELARLEPAAQTAYLRLLSDALGRAARPPQTQPMQEPLAAPQPPALMEQEIAQLPATRCLSAQGVFAVYLARAEQIPSTLAEIGRLRELSFRLVGEGTGRGSDLDRFDAAYEHLFVWHHEKREVIGAYRIGFTDALCAAGAADKLYTNTLFDFDARLIQRIGPAIELGRSFVRPEWQRNFRSLRLLWSGIAAILDAHPDIRCLFGPVSISASYSAAGRRLMEAALSRHHSDPALTELVRPRTPSRKRGESGSMRPVVAALGDPSLLSRVIGRLDPGQGGLPVLVRHYLDLKGRFAGFNVDAKFGDTLDGLVFIQVGDIPPRVRAKFGTSRAG